MILKTEDLIPMHEKWLRQLFNINNADFAALCPYCEIDSVLGDASGFKISDTLLQKMQDYWF